MRSLLALAAALLCQPALAADLNIYKAKPNVLATYQGSQFYMLLGTVMETDKATVAGLNGTAFNGYVAAGKLAAGVGYIYGMGANWAAVEAWATATNVGNASGMNPAAPGSISLKTAGFTERLMWGGAYINGLINNVMSLIPNLGLPTLPTTPPGAVNPHPYVFGALHQDQIGAQYMLADNKVWRMSWGVGLGVQTQFTPTTTPGAVPVTMDMAVEYKGAGQGITLGNTGAGTIGGATIGGGVLASVTFKH